MYGTVRDRLQATLLEIDSAGLTKPERVIVTPQGGAIAVADGKQVLNFCANNYLGLANDPRIVAAAHQGLDRWGYGLSSVRFICGTQAVHKQLEAEVARFFGTEDTILYSSCFDANAGVFETLLGEQDAVISDALNHASIIDGIRLCKAQRFRYEHGNKADLERALIESQTCRSRLVVTDGVFSMDGDVADLASIADLCDQYQALLMVDESHSTGFFGPKGRGVPAYHGVQTRVDLISSTLGKALGGASGGFVTGHKEIVALLKQRSRPYLFSNTLAPAIAAASIEALKIIDAADDLRARLQANTEQFRSEMTAAGFTLRPGIHPIAPVMLGDAKLAQEMAKRLLDEGIYVIGFSFPVVPVGQARIRVQLSAAHTSQMVSQCVAAFCRVGRGLGVIG
ncbi:MAG: glycine C-acetyltransferase [Myxococcales bacterium]|nr:glycine C-acetyltransferase [Myxococcales bacterium]